VESSVFVYKPINFQLQVVCSNLLTMEDFEEKTKTETCVTFISNSKEVSNYVTKRSVWNSELMCWQNNLGARVKYASYNNFILIKDKRSEDETFPIFEELYDLRKPHPTINSRHKVFMRHGKVYS
jgi:hypothetical protein